MDKEEGGLILRVLKKHFRINDIIRVCRGLFGWEQGQSIQGGNSGERYIELSMTKGWSSEINTNVIQRLALRFVDSHRKA